MYISGALCPVNTRFCDAFLHKMTMSLAAIDDHQNKMVTNAKV